MIIHDFSIERRALSGIIRNKDLIIEKTEKLTPSLFTDADGVNRVICKVLIDFYKEGKEFDPINIASYVKSYNISFKKINMGDVSSYIQTLCNITTSFKQGCDAIDRLYDFKVRNALLSSVYKTEKYLSNDAGKHNTQKIIENATKLFTQVTDVYDLDRSPLDITENIGELIKSRIESEKPRYVPSPFQIFNDLYGGFRNGNVYAFVARPKHGKTTFLTWASAMIVKQSKVKVLYIDTEMETDDIKFRMVSAYSGVLMDKIENGELNDDEKAKLRVAVKQYKEDLGEKFYHYHCPNKTTDQIIHIVKRWILRNVNEGEQCIVVYDYIKMTGESTSEHNKEYQIIGQKVDKLKALATEFNFPLLTACQLNRDAEKGNDDTSAISQSDRLTWFASYVGIFRRKRPEEFDKYGRNYGTHSLISLVTRFQGKKAQGHTMTTVMPEQTATKQVVKKNIPFFINFQIDNFTVRELNTSDDIARNLLKQYEVKSDNGNREDSTI